MGQKQVGNGRNCRPVLQGEVMRYGKLGLLSGVLLFCATQGTAADWYVSLTAGNNKNAGTKEAPFKNIWKAIENAAPGDTLHVAAGNYPGKMSCGWINMDKPVNLIGGYNADFSERNPLIYHTMLRPSNAQNATKPTFGTLTVKTRKFGPDSNILIDGFIFDHTLANSYHAREGKPEGFEHGMLTIPPAKGTTKNPSIDKALLNAETDGTFTIQNCLFLNGGNFAVLERKHHAVQATETKGTYSASDYPDMQELLAAADVLITDYSSCMWDFALTDKPGFLYFPDVRQFDRNKDFYTQPEEWPYEYAESTEALRQLILSYDPEKAEKRRNAFFEKVGNYEKGTACAQLAELLKIKKKENR